MTELELIIDLHKRQNRQGPGSDNETLRALSFMTLDDSQTLQIADIGCGSGAASLVLSKQLNAKFTAIDLFPAFLEQLTLNAQQQSLTDKIVTLQADMTTLPFEKQTFDVIWSEGAIYNMGFEKGINYWKQFLKPGGYMALSEITWLNSTRPKDIEQFWQREYPEIASAAIKIQQLEKQGFSLKGYFPLSAESWLNNYYMPLEATFDDFLQRNGNSTMTQEIVTMHKEEIALYRKFKNDYSYGFYIVQKL